MPEQASNFAHSVDALFLFLVWFSVFFTVVIVGAIVYFGIRYKRRSDTDAPRPIEGHHMLEMAWIVGPLVILIILFLWSGVVFFKMYRPPADALDIYVVGKQWMWKIQHPEGHREINELHVPLGRPVKLTVTSEDVIHSFFIPAFRIKIDAVPGRYGSMWFEATKTGEYHLFCAEYCGTDHSAMIGRVIVMEPEAYDRWLTERTEEADETMAARGRKVYERLNCVLCHAQGSAQPGPYLNGLYGKPVALADGRTVRADKDYLRESILEPNKKITRGYDAVMPTYKGQVTEEEILEIIAYIQSLK